MNRWKVHREPELNRPTWIARQEDDPYSVHAFDTWDEAFGFAQYDRLTPERERIEAALAKGARWS